MPDNQTITERLKLLERRAAISDALNEAIEIFTSHSENMFEDVMSGGLRVIADAAGFHRVSIYHRLDGRNRLGQTYLWHGTTVPLKEELTVLPDIPPIARWADILTKGSCINTDVSRMAKDEADFLRPLGVKAILFVPIFTYGVFWGVVAMEDHRDHMTFEADCLDILTSAARLCANVFIQMNTNQSAADAYVKLLRREQSMEMLNRTAIQFLSQREETFEEMLNDGIWPIADETGLDRVAVYSYIDIDGKKRLGQLYLWGRAEKGAVPLDDSLRILPELPAVNNWIEILSGGKSVNICLDDMTEDEKDFLSVFGVKSIILAPVFMQGKFWGAVSFQNHTNARHFADADAGLFHSTAHLLANAIINAEMDKKIFSANNLLAARLEQQEMMADISNGFIASGDAGTLVDEALAKLGRYYNVSLVLIFSLNYQRGDAMLAYSWVADDSRLQIVDMSLFDLITGHFPEQMPEGGDPLMLICPDTAASPFSKLKEVDVYAFIGVPLYVEGRLWGLMSVEQCHTPREWTKSETEFTAMTASTVAGAIMRDIYDRERTEALERATAASRAKGDFLSNMSHEMRTPLNAIIGMTAIGKNAASIERKDYTLNKIEDASTNLLAVINDVLDMSKIEANKLELSPVEFNVERMLQKVVSVVKFRMDERRQRFDIHVDVNVPHFIVNDDQRLSQVIINLLSNACKFSPEDTGRIRLGVSLLGDQDGLCSLRFEVADNGIGISPEQQAKLFQAFAQADSGTSRKFGGTGLGLALCKRIVELMGGEIWVESEAGKGARFIFTVKAARGTQSLISLFSPHVKRESLRILAAVGGDTAGYVKGTFAGIGIRCDAAADGVEALRMAGDGYDICFVDMPDMDGIELIRRLNAIDKEIFTVLISDGWAVIREEALEAGVDKYLMKPLFSPALAECVNECLDAESGRRGGSPLEKTHGIFTGRRLLIAEDVEINREILISLLSDSGLGIEEAEDGLEALEKVEADPERYDLVFMDMQMPQMDGLEATRRIRALPSPRAKTLPIIAMTANVFKEDIDRCLEAGMNAHIGKPLDIDDILSVLRKYLKRNH